MALNCKIINFVKAVFDCCSYLNQSFLEFSLWWLPLLNCRISNLTPRFFDLAMKAVVFHSCNLFHCPSLKSALCRNFRCSEMPVPWSVSGGCICLVQYWNSCFSPSCVGISSVVHLCWENLLMVSFLFPFNSCVVNKMQKPFLNLQIRHVLT